MAPSAQKLHERMPPLIVGTGTFSEQYNNNPQDAANLPAVAIVKKALDLGVNAFDTSPWYGPSETILGDALAHPTVAESHPRDSYFLTSKAGRYRPGFFDYSPAYIRYSVYRSLDRLHTDYLDLVLAHDVEFVSEPEVLAAVRELRRLREEEGRARYVGISGFPIDVLLHYAELILKETGEPLDAVLTYGHYTIQNQALTKNDMLDRFQAAGVDVVINASLLGLGLLTGKNLNDLEAVPAGAWHPASKDLRQACYELNPLAGEDGLPAVALRWAMDSWAREGARVGSGAPNPALSLDGGKRRMGISLSGISKVSELEQTYELFQSVRAGLLGDGEGNTEKGKEAVELRNKMQSIVDAMRKQLGGQVDKSWDSPGGAWTNPRKPEEMGVVPTDDGIMEKYLPKT